MVPLTVIKLYPDKNIVNIGAEHQDTGKRFGISRRRCTFESGASMWATIVCFIVLVGLLSTEINAPAVAEIFRPFHSPNSLGTKMVVVILRMT